MYKTWHSVFQHDRARNGSWCVLSKIVTANQNARLRSRDRWQPMRAQQASHVTKLSLERLTSALRFVQDNCSRISCKIWWRDPGRRGWSFGWVPGSTCHNTLQDIIPFIPHIRDIFTMNWPYPPVHRYMIKDSLGIRIYVGSKASPMISCQLIAVLKHQHQRIIPLFRALRKRGISWRLGLCQFALNFS